MSKLVHGFIGAAIVMGVTACSSNPVQSNKSASTPTFTDEEKAILLSVARVKSDQIAKNAVNILTASDVFAKLAKARKIEPKMCDFHRDIEKSGGTKKLNEVYSATISDEIKYGGELEDEKVHRLTPVKNIAAQIDKNLETIKRACDLKYGA